MNCLRNGNTVKLNQIKEILYYVFYFSQLVCVAWGWGTADLPYKVIFGIGTICLLICMFYTSYSIKEKICMIILSGLAAVAFFRNGNRSLILALMAVFGCKDINIKKILGYSLWIYVVFTALKVSFCAIGVLPNEVLWLPKENGEYYHIRSYGYDTANGLYFHLVVIVLLAAVRYEGRRLWRILLLITVFMFAAYKVLRSRTGFICYLVFLILYLIYHVMKKIRAEKYFLRVLVISPLLLCLMNWLFIWIYGVDNNWVELLNDLVNGRIRLASNAFFEYGLSMLGSRGAGQLDMLYATMLLDYGLVLSVVGIFGYIKALWLLYRRDEGIIIISMTVLAVYSFMEVNAINPIWNPFLLYLAPVLFSHTEDRHKESIITS